MKKIFSLTLIFAIVVCCISVHAAPTDNFEYIDYPGTKFIFDAENGFVFNMLDGRKIYIDEYGNETTDIVGVMGQNAVYLDEGTTTEEKFGMMYLLDDNNNLIVKLPTDDYDFVEREDYIAVSDRTKPVDERTFIIYSTTDGSKMAELSAKDYIIGNTYSGAPEFDLIYWSVSKNGYFWFADEKGLGGISDIKGNVIVEPKYKHLNLCDYDRDLFKAETDKGVVIIDKDGKIIKELESHSVGKLAHEDWDIVKYFAENEKGARTPLDYDFNKLSFFDEGYSYMWSLDNNHFAVGYADAYQRPQMLMGVMNSEGKIVVPIEYEYIEKVDHNRMKVKSHNTDGWRLTYFDGSIIEDNCSFITPVGDNGYIGISKRDFEGYIDQFNNRVIKLKNGYMVQGPFSEGKAAIIDDYWDAPFGQFGGSTAYINEKGDIVLKDSRQKWYKGMAFKNDIAFVANSIQKHGVEGWLLIKYTGDTPSDWAEASVKAAVDNNLLPVGAPYYLNSLYKQSITREEFCVIAVRIIQAINGNRLDESAAPFTDTQNPSVYMLYNAGIIEGKSKTEFAPRDLITREEAAKILDSMYVYLQIEQPKTDEKYVFADDDKISDWAKARVYNMNAAGIMKGTGNNKFSPQDNYTREQAIVTFMRIFICI